LQLDDLSNHNICAEANINNNDIKSEDNTIECDEQSLTKSTQDNKYEPVDISIPENSGNNNRSSIIIKLKHDFEVEMSRRNILELSMITKPNNMAVGNIFLQSARERDVLYTILTALIDKKKELQKIRKQAKNKHTRNQTCSLTFNELQRDSPSTNSIITALEECNVNVSVNVDANTTGNNPENENDKAIIQKKEKKTGLGTRGNQPIDNGKYSIIGREEDLEE